MANVCPGCREAVEAGTECCPACGLLQESRGAPPPPETPSGWDVPPLDIHDETGAPLHPRPARTRRLGPLILLVLGLLSLPLVLRSFAPRAPRVAAPEPERVSEPPAEPVESRPSDPVPSPDLPPIEAEPDLSGADAHVELRRVLRLQFHLFGVSAPEKVAGSTSDEHRVSAQRMGLDFDLDALDGRIPLGHRFAFDRALATHVPLHPQAGQDLHAFFDSFLARLLELDPDLAIALGLHPHPTGVTRLDDETYYAVWLLARDAMAALADWPEVGSLSVHERTDRAVVRHDLASQLLRKRDRGRDQVLGMSRVFDPLMTLHLIECCPVEERARAAIDRLGKTPRALRATADALVSPSPALLASTLEQLADGTAYLREYAGLWDGLSPAIRKQLEEQCDRCADAVDALHEELTRNVLPHATGPTGMGLENLNYLLRTRYALRLRPGQWYYNALLAFDRACKGLDGLEDRLYDEDQEAASFDDLPPETHIDRLRLSSGRAFRIETKDPGLAVRPIPSCWQSLGAQAFHFRPGPLAGRVPAIVLLADPEPSEDPVEQLLDEIAEVHTLAHETYPGHHLEFAGREGLCSIRTFHEDPVFIEGWARYAEGLIHDLGACVGGPTDTYTRRADDAHYAWLALLDILIQSEQVSLEQIRAWMQLYRGTEVTLAEVGAAASMPGRLLTYHVGERHLRDLIRRSEARDGAAFDLPALHDKLIRSGGIPVRLLEAELR